MAYLCDIPQEKCRRCGKKATVELHHWRNHLLDYYCAKCGTVALKAQQQREGREEGR